MNHWWNKKYKMVALFILVGLMIDIQQSWSLLTSSLDNKETSLDVEGEDDDLVYPLLGIFLSSENSFKEEIIKINNQAIDSCEAEVNGVKDETPESLTRNPEFLCVRNELVLYHIDHLKIKSCQWNKDALSSVTFKTIESMMTEINIENINIFFRDKVLLCTGMLVLPSGKKIPLQGICSVQNSTSFRLVNGEKPKFGEDPIFTGFVFEPDGESVKQLVQPLIMEKIGRQVSSILSMSIPLTKKGSDYLSYMLTNTAINACKARSKKYVK